MSRLQKKSNALARRKHRIRGSIYGSPERPRLTVSISNMHVSAQIIDDTKGNTLAYATTQGQKKLSDKPLTEKAAFVGEEIAKKAQKAKVKQVSFDRNGRRYHSRLSALADAARAGGLEF